MKNEVFISGMGIISSNASNKKEFNYALQSGKTNFSLIDNGKLPFICSKLIEFDFLERMNEYKRIDSAIITKVERYIRRQPWEVVCTILSALEAYFEFRENVKEYSKEKVGIIITGNSFAEYTFSSQSYNNIIPSKFIQTIETYYIGVLSEIFGFKGISYYVGGASASGSIGIINAVSLIKSGCLDSCLIVAPAYMFSEIVLKGYYNIGALGGNSYFGKPNEACRPFDKDHEGFIPGQAAAAIFLTRKNDIVQADNLYEISKYAYKLHCTGGTRPSLEAEETVISEVFCGQSEYKNGEFLYINAHGTSTPLGDDIELQAIENVFADKLSRTIVNSTKGLVGHCMNSAGIIETIAIVMQMKYKFIHKNVNLHNPIKREVCLPETNIQKVQIKTAIKNAFAFNGINTAFLVRKK